MNNGSKVAFHVSGVGGAAGVGWGFGLARPQWAPRGCDGAQVYRCCWFPFIAPQFHVPFHVTCQDPLQDWPQVPIHCKHGTNQPISQDNM